MPARFDDVHGAAAHDLVDRPELWRRLRRELQGGAAGGLLDGAGVVVDALQLDGAAANLATSIRTSRE